MSVLALLPPRRSCTWRLDINDQITIWGLAPEPGVARDDFAALNQGQLKAIAQMVYNRLRQVGYFGPPLESGKLYPWGSAGAIEDAYSVANLGQLKHVFSFFAGQVYLDAYLVDSDLDGMPDGWEIEKGLDPFDATDAALMTGGQTNLQIYQQSQTGGGEPASANPVSLLVYSP